MNSSVRLQWRSWIFFFGFLATGGALSARPVATVGEMLAELLGQPAGRSNYFVIPVAGHVVGAQGTEFRSDVTIGAAVRQRVAVAWLAQGVDSTAEGLDFLEVGPDPSFFSDMIAGTLGKTGLGALVVAAITADGALDPSGTLRGFARVWTPIPGCSGTSSFSMPGGMFVSPDFYNGLKGLLLDAGHRGTIGVVNPGAYPVTGIVHVFAPDYTPLGEIEVPVPGRSMRQVPIPATNVGLVSFWIELKEIHVFVGVPKAFAAYATSIDQVSGDAMLLSHVVD